VLLFSLSNIPSYCVVKPAFHDADTDIEILTRILADTSDTRDFLKLFLWQLASWTTRRHSRDNPCENFSEEDVGVGVVECGLYRLGTKPGADRLTSIISCYKIMIQLKLSVLV